VTATQKVIGITPRENGHNYGREKELTSCYSLIGSRKGLGDGWQGKPNMAELITVRTYMGRSNSASVVYASVWCHFPNDTGTPGCYAAGHGSAGGYGYHKSSAAIHSALRDAGFKFKREIAGVGESAVRDALTAIARHFGYRKTLIVEH
jgi:hypothetical protein